MQGSLQCKLAYTLLDQSKNDVGLLVLRDPPCASPLGSARSIIDRALLAYVRSSAQLTSFQITSSVCSCCFTYDYDSTFGYDSSFRFREVQSMRDAELLSVRGGGNESLSVRGAHPACSAMEG